MEEIICKEVVVSTLTRRGQGKKHSPIRQITQVFEKDGKLIAEYDPCPETFTKGDMLDFARFCHKEDICPGDTAIEIVDLWLDSLEKIRDR